MKKDVTSEEKLLNLIRKKNPLENKGNKKEPKSSAPGWAPSPVAKDASDISGLLIKALLVVCLGLAIYIGTHVFLAKNTSDVAVVPLVEERTGNLIAEQVALPAPLPFSEYQTAIGARDIFASPFQRAQSNPETDQAAQAAAVTPAYDLSQNFKLVGIILDRDPKAVVEDMRNQKTKFLSKGDRLEGAILEDIQDGKAVFLMNNQRIELIP